MLPISPEFVRMDCLVFTLEPKLSAACLDALETLFVDQLKDFRLAFVDVPSSVAQSVGVNLVALGNDKIL